MTGKTKVKCQKLASFFVSFYTDRSEDGAVMIIA
jgi:hypothetical protein